MFKGSAARGESSTGWFYGFKLHLIINHLGDIINLKLPSGNVHDTAVIEQLTHELKGILLGDKGYLSKVKTGTLASRGLRLITPKHRKPKTADDKSLFSIVWTD